MAAGSRHRGGDLFLVPAFAANAGAGTLAALRHPLRQERRAALRAGLDDGAGPGDELALGVLAAGVEGLAPLAATLDELAAATLLGARDPEGHGLGRLALGVTGARDEFAETSVLDHHRLAARRACLVRHLIGGLLAAAQVLGVLAEAPPRLEDRLAAIGALLARVLPDLVVRHVLLRLADVLIELRVELPH